MGVSVSGIKVFFLGFVLSLSMVARSESGLLSSVDLDFKSIKIKNYTFDTQTQRYVAQDGSFLKLSRRKMPEGDAHKFLGDQLYQHRLLYQPQSAPYPGMLTKDVSCSEGIVLPKDPTDTVSATYWFSEVPATKALLYGTCGSIEEPYWSQILLLYCKKTQTFFDVRIFKPKGEKASPWGAPIANCP